MTRGICDVFARRDNMKRYHCPKKDAGLVYIEKGDKTSKYPQDFF